MVIGPARLEHAKAHASRQYLERTKQPASLITLIERFRLATYDALRVRESSVMNARNFGLGSYASRRCSFRRTRTLVAKILMRFSDAYADLALWIAPWLGEDGEDR